MKFGTKLKLKKDWQYGLLTFEKGDILQVALYEHKHGLKLYHPQVGEIIDFIFGYNDREERIEEWFEVLEEFDDRLAELEALIREWFITNGKANGGDRWFEIAITTRYKSKNLHIYDTRGWAQYDLLKRFVGLTTKEMFDKAFEFFKLQEK